MIKICYFAGLREVTGKSDEMLNRDQMTIEQLQHWIASKYEGFDSGSIWVAVNEEYAQLSDTIRSGDTVALIPPISGG